MNCPACSQKLSLAEVEGIRASACKDGCGGLWFERGEVRKVDVGSEPLGQKLVELQNASSKVQASKKEKRSCPMCREVIMRHRFYSVKRDAEVDECAGCGGIWVDAGSLERIRAEFATGDERETAQQKAFEQMANPQMAELKATESSPRAKRWFGLFRKGR